MALHESVLVFPLQVKNVFIAAFYGTITCGLLKDQVFGEENSFSTGAVFDLSGGRATY